MAENLKQLRSRLDALKTQRAKDEGAFEQTLKRIKDEFGCKTIDAARALYAKMKADNDKLGQGVETQGEQVDGLLTDMEQAVAGR